MADAREQGKVFVGNLGRESSQESLITYFSRYGKVKECILPVHAETKRPRGFAFVKLESDAIAEHVISTGPHTIDGKLVNLHSK